MIREFLEAARSVLKYPLLAFTDAEIQIMGARLRRNDPPAKLHLLRLRVLPDHVHLLIRKHRDQAETMIAHLQDSSREALRTAGSRPADHPVWGGPGWKVYLETRDDIQRTIAYIRKNLLQARPPALSWPFVQPYDGWLPLPIRRIPRSA